MPKKGSGLAREQAVLLLCDGVKTSSQIAEMIGDNAKYVQRVMKKRNAPRLRQAPPTGDRNPAYKTGRKIDRDGYVLVSAPLGHPNARMRDGRSYGLIYEHRLILEQKLGRYLLPSEAVDHIDGLRLHNSPSNLRVFDSNADHLQETISGQIPKWSEAGLEKLRTSPFLRSCLPRIDNYNLMKKNGDARLRQILLAALQLGIDSPYLLGTSHHLEKAGISDFSDSSLKRELLTLSQRYA